MDPQWQTPGVGICPSAKHTRTQPEHKRDRNASHDRGATGDSERARERGTGATSNANEKTE